MTNLSETQKRPRFIFQDDSDGFGVLKGKDSSHIAWESIARWVERPSYYLIYHDASERRILPKRGSGRRTSGC